MKCAIMTFWQYVLIGLKDFFSSPAPSEYKNQKWTTKVVNYLIGVLFGLLFANAVIWLVKLLNIFDQFITAMLWFFATVTVIELTALLVFLYVCWRRALRDCWDKFQ